MMKIELQNIQSLDDILSSFFATLAAEEATLSLMPPLLMAMRDMYVQNPTSSIDTFSLDDEAIAMTIKYETDY